MVEFLVTQPSGGADVVTTPPASLAPGALSLDASSKILLVGDASSVPQRAFPPVFAGAWGYLTGGRTNTGVQSSGVFNQASVDTMAEVDVSGKGQAMRIDTTANLNFVKRLYVGAGGATRFVACPAQRPWLLTRIQLKQITFVQMWLGWVVGDPVGQGGGTEPVDGCAIFNFDSSINAKWTLVTRETSAESFDRQTVTGSPDVAVDVVYYQRLRFNVAGDAISELFDENMVLLGSRTILASGSLVPLSTAPLRFLIDIRTKDTNAKQLDVFDSEVRCER